jgi:hypothetical protein
MPTSAPPHPGAGLRPVPGAVGRAVVGQDPLDGHTAGREPVHRAVQDVDCSGGFLVIADLGIGDPGVVVDDRVDERGPEQRAAVFVAGLVRCRGAVPAALDASDLAPAAAVGHVAEFLDVDVEQVAGCGVFIAADRFPADPVEVAEPVEPAPHEHRVHGRGGQAEPVTDADRSESSFPAQVHDLADQRRRGAAGLPMRA